MGLFTWLHIHNSQSSHHSDQQIISWQHGETPFARYSIIQRFARFLIELFSCLQVQGCQPFFLVNKISRIFNYDM